MQEQSLGATAMPTLSNTQRQIKQICEDVQAMLLKKNEKYGDSAINPIRLFSTASTVEQIYVRLDDKLNRIKQSNGKWTDDEDVIMDIIGYLVLLKIAKNNDDKWDGTTIEPIPLMRKSFTNISEDYIHDGIVSLHTAGDRFG